MGMAWKCVHRDIGCVHLLEQVLRWSRILALNTIFHQLKLMVSGCMSRDIFIICSFLIIGRHIRQAFVLPIVSLLRESSCISPDGLNYAPLSSSKKGYLLAVNIFPLVFTDRKLYRPDVLESDNVQRNTALIIRDDSSAQKLTPH